MKKKNRIDPSAPSFLTPQLHSEQTRNFFPPFGEYLTACCYTFGILLFWGAMGRFLLAPAGYSPESLTLAALFAIPITAILGGFLFPALFVWLFRVKKHRLIWWLIASGGLILLTLLFFSDLLTGIRLMQNVLATCLSDKTSITLEPWRFEYLTFQQAQLGLSAFYLFCALLSSFLSSWFAAKLKWFWPFLLITLPAMFGAYYLMEEPLDSSSFLLLLSLCGAASLALYRARRKSKKCVNKTVQRIPGSSSAPTAVLFCAAAVLFLVVQILPRSAFVRPEAFKKLTRDPIGFFRETFTGGFGEHTVGGLSGGQLGNVESVSFTGDEMLRISVDSGGTTRPFLLKGYTGWEYDGHSFKATEIKELDSLQKRTAAIDNLSLLSLIHPYVSGPYAVPESYTSVQLHIENTGASDRYVYLPYNLYGVTRNWRAVTPGETNGDTGVKREGYFDRDLYYAAAQIFPRQTVHLPIDKVDLPFQQTRDELLHEYTKLAQKYYTRLPDDDRYDWAAPYFEDAGTVEEVCNIVRDIITASETTYTTSPGKTPKDKDFVNYFLQASKKGYCAHYAAAAVVLFREAGIPARYVEGYTVDWSSAADKYKPVSVKDSAAHAWAEIYLEEYGWIPMDFTPAGTNNTEEVSSAPAEESSEPPESSETAESILIEDSSLPESPSDVSVPGGADLPSGTHAEPGVWPRILLVLFVMLFTVWLTLWIRRYILQNKRKSRQRMRTAEDVCAVYRDCLLLLRFVKTAMDRGETAAHFAERVDRLYPFENTTFEQVTELAARMRFSNMPPTTAQCGEITFYYKVLRRRILKELRGIKRLKFIWIDVL